MEKVWGMKSHELVIQFRKVNQRHCRYL